LARQRLSQSAILSIAVVLAGVFLVSACGTPEPIAQKRVSTASEPLPRLTPAPNVVGDPERGRTTFVDKGCVTCHTLRGVPAATGIIGPNLTNVALRPTLTEANFPNNPDQMARWIMDPPTMKPGTVMPNLGLTDAQARDLTAFLYSYPYNAPVR
jgi:cytochrome c2